ncbi:hypothetical protein KO561_06950 [Radiobacillus kanasensis]|uniref:hypothetical protein n=1 Tax=Radiobacillus kanasensis TaxID=2844358 RepID=UPI001E4FB074|nr:hypothetical protein [Radiobacillus kanasensis]UFU00666.1 hypothetical protein KO561_06950 [Radiobacillus kanasensis]
MKFKILSTSLLLGAFLVGNASGVSAQVEESPKLDDSPAIQLGAGEWDNIGEYTFSNSIRFQSGGGDLKVCVKNTDDSVRLVLEKAPLWAGDSEYTSGSGKNCAIWRDIGIRGAYDLYNMSNRSLEVTVYD